MATRAPIAHSPATSAKGIAVMVAVSSATSTAAVATAQTRPLSIADPQLGQYRANWTPLSSAPQVTPAAPLQAANDRTASDPKTVHAHALLAADVYNDTPSPPEGYRVATDAELEALGLDPEQLDPGTDAFRARVYASDRPGEDFVIAFRGSQSGADWLTNVRQGVGLDSDHYARALEIGRTIARSDAVVTMAGHSLGAGLASTAAIASGSHADTFNGAGLHADTIADARAIADSAGRTPGGVDNYRVPGEILTLAQEGGDRVLGGLLGGIPGALLVDIPPAYGTQHTLADVRPDGVNWFEGLNIIDRHGMNWVLAGTAALR